MLCGFIAIDLEHQHVWIPCIFYRCMWPANFWVQLLLFAQASGYEN